MRQNVDGSEACPGKWKLCDEEFRPAPGPGTPRMAVALGMLLLGLLPFRRRRKRRGSRTIQTYYQELMPTIRQAARLTVRERDRRFTPAITGVFDWRP